MDTSARLLRPIETPSTTASSITIAVAIKLIDSLIIVSSHRPVHKLTASHTSVTTAGRQPPRTYATASSTSAITHHGDSDIRSCSGLMSSVVTVSLSQIVNVSTLLTNQSVNSLM